VERHAHEARAALAHLHHESLSDEGIIGHGRLVSDDLAPECLPALGGDRCEKTIGGGCVLGEGWQRGEQ
jgi:hypothetical protein